MSYSFTCHKNNDVAICTCKCTYSLSHIKLFKTHCNAQIEKKIFFRTHRKRGSFILLLLAIIIRDAGYREHYIRRPPSQRRLCRHRCITTLSPDVTRNELGALPSQTSHRLKLSSPVPRECGKRHIGETCRPLQTRVNEHKRNTTNGELDKSKIVEHSREQKHRFQWDKASIINKEENSRIRKFKESAFIHCTYHVISQPSIGISRICFQ